MGDFSGAQELRNLLALAARLRGLAAATPVAADRDLYLNAAAALEARAAWMARSLPGERFDGNGLYRRVDVLV